MSNKILGLTTVITFKKELKGRKEVIVASHVYVALKTEKGNIGVASATFGGKWDEKYTLLEFKKNPNRFKLIEEGYNIAKAAKLC